MKNECCIPDCCGLIAVCFQSTKWPAQEDVIQKLHNASHKLFQQITATAQTWCGRTAEELEGIKIWEIMNNKFIIKYGIIRLYSCKLDENEQFLKKVKVLFCYCQIYIVRNKTNSRSYKQLFIECLLKNKMRSYASIYGPFLAFYICLKGNKI